MGWGKHIPFLSLLLVLVLLPLISAAVAAELDIVGDGSEFMLDTEIHRRFLAGRPYYISYGSLSADRVPCPPMSGKSYYNPNCNRRGAANPYKRGCSTITRCRRDVS